MLRKIGVIFIVLLAISFIGCGLKGKSIVAKQEWSKNYALDKGVEATSPLMIDGDPRTMGETQLPTDVSSGSTRLTEALVKLPEAKKIRKIVIQSANLRSFIVYYGGKTPDDWKLVEEFKNIEDNKVAINTNVTTDRIKVRIMRTSEDTTEPGGRGGQARLKRAPGKIYEIELYGFEEAEEVSESIASKSLSPTGATTETAPVVEVPKAPKLSSFITSEKAYPLSGPIPIKVNIKAGEDEIIILEDMVSSAMIATKLIVQDSSGTIIPCSKPTPPLSSPRPYRSTDKPIDVRNAKTIDPNSVISIDIANILDFYPIKTSGTYTIQLKTSIDLHDKFVGRDATAKTDVERQIRDINSKANYTQQEKAALIQSLREEMQQSSKKRAPRYIEVYAKGTPFELESAPIEITIQ